MRISNNLSAFCDKFLDEKKAFYSPKLTPSLGSDDERNNYALKLSLSETDSPKNANTTKTKSRLIYYKDIVNRALETYKKNNKKNELQTLQLDTKQTLFPRKSFREFDVDKMPPILHNNLKMFVNKIRRIGYLNDLSGMKPYDLKIINDQTYYEPEEEKTHSSIYNCFNMIFDSLSGKIHFLKLKLNFNRSDIGLIHPYNSMKLVWDLQIFLMIVFLIFYIPLSVAFGIELVDKNTKLGLSVVFMIDMFFEMNTLYFHYGMEVRNRKQIMKNYLKTYLFPDLFSILALLSTSNENYVILNLGSFLELLFFLKIYSLKRISKKIMNRFQFSHEWKGVKDLLILFFVIIFIAHLAACGWYYVGILSNKEHYPNNWIKTQNLLNQEWTIQYMSAFYWSIVTVMTVGYGDITPQNNLERLVCLFVILFGGMIFPYSINSIGSIIEDIRRDKKKFE